MKNFKLDAGRQTTKAAASFAPQKNSPFPIPPPKIFIYIRRSDLSLIRITFPPYSTVYSSQATSWWKFRVQDIYIGRSVIVAPGGMVEKQVEMAHAKRGTRARGEQRKEKSQRGEMRKAHSCNNRTKRWGNVDADGGERAEEGRKETSERRRGERGGGLSRIGHWIGEIKWEAARCWRYRRPFERNADVGIIIDTSLLAEELCIFHSVCRRTRSFANAK